MDKETDVPGRISLPPTVIVQMTTHTTIPIPTCDNTKLVTNVGDHVRLPVDIALVLINNGQAVYADQRTETFTDWSLTRPSDIYEYRKALYWAAVDLVNVNIPVLPGSVENDGHYYTRDGRPTDGIQPLCPLDFATTSKSVLYDWWLADDHAPLVPSLLVVAGCHVDIWSTDLSLGIHVIKTNQLITYCPAIHDPRHGRLYFLTVPVTHEPPPDRFDAWTFRLPHGTPVPVPPSRLARGVTMQWAGRIRHGFQPVTSDMFYRRLVRAARTGFENQLG